jgi:hypothetical protein
VKQKNPCIVGKFFCFNADWRGWRRGRPRKVSPPLTAINRKPLHAMMRMRPFARFVDRHWPLARA